jgi:hypothetical protein
MAAVAACAMLAAALTGVETSSAAPAAPASANAPEAASATIVPSLSPDAASATIVPSLSPDAASATIVPSLSPDATSATIAPSLSPNATSATIAPSLSPNRLGAKGALTLAIQYTGGEAGVPSPVQRSVLRLPAGLTLEIPSLRSCSVATLENRGPSGCPPQSLVGRGHALAEALAGSEVIAEEVTLLAFIGPPQGNEPTFELLGEGSNPVPAQVVVTGTVVPAHAPYGEELVIPIPPIPTLPSVSDTSLANLTLTIGTSEPRLARNSNAVLLPTRCPAGGFPFAAAFTYADGSSGSAFAKALCPVRAKTATRTATAARTSTTAKATTAARTATRSSTPRAASAGTVSLRETGNLRLTGKHGFTLDEQGPATGTFSGTIHVRLTIVSTDRVQATVSISRSGGSISGEASASYRREGGSASFSGSLSIGGGTGSYSHAHGTGLSFGGTIQNSTDAIAVHLSGPISD